MALTLKALRVNAGMKQEDAAKMLDVSVKTLCSWERGETFPNVKQITKIEGLYKVSYSDIKFLPDSSV